MIGYVASSYSYDGYDANEYHHLTYSGLKDYVDINTYNEFTNPDQINQHGKFYRRDMFTNPNLLSQQLPYYQIRVLYVASINLLAKLGMNPFFSTYFIPALSCFFALLIIGVILLERLSLNIIALFFPILLIAFGLLKVAGLGNPDGLAFFMVVFVSYFFMTSNVRIFLLMLPVLILVRTDLILLVFCFGFYFFFINRSLLKWYIVSAAFSLAAYLAINSFFDNYGWHTIFYVSFIERVSNPAELKLLVSLDEYFNVLVKGITGVWRSTIFIAFTLISLIIAWIHYKNRTKNNFLSIKNMQNNLAIIHYIGIFYIIIHFILFPVIWHRFFIAQYAFTLIYALSLMPKLSNQSIRV